MSLVPTSGSARVPNSKTKRPGQVRGRERGTLPQLTIICGMCQTRVCLDRWGGGGDHAWTGVGWGVTLCQTLGQHILGVVSDCGSPCSSCMSDINTYWIVDTPGWIIRDGCGGVVHTWLGFIKFFSIEFAHICRHLNITRKPIKR